MENGIILSPDLERLREDIARMRAELTSLVTERDELKYVICPRLGVMLWAKFSLLERALEEAKKHAAALKRMTEMVQAQLNRGQAADFDRIEAQIRADQAAYDRRLSDLAEKILKAYAESRRSAQSGESGAQDEAPTAQSEDAASSSGCIPM